MSPSLKKPKTEPLEEEEKEDSRSSSGGGAVEEEEEGFEGVEEQEEALVAIVEYRANEVGHLQQRVAYYNKQLADAKTRLQDAEAKLARVRARKNVMSQKSSTPKGSKSLMGLTDLWTVGNGSRNVKEEPKSTSPIRATDEVSRKGFTIKTQLLIPSVDPKVFQPKKSEDTVTKTSTNSDAETNISTSSKTTRKPKVEKGSLDWVVVETKDRGSKRKLEEKQQHELIQLIGRNSSPCTVQCHTDNLISSQHKRKLRTLVLCPSDDQLFVTRYLTSGRVLKVEAIENAESQGIVMRMNCSSSDEKWKQRYGCMNALDGVVNLWQLQSDGSTAALLGTSDCLSPNLRRWPEDIAWHPYRKSLFSVYTADDGDSQISILNLGKTQGKNKLTFLEDKPHVKGIIHRILFMPWKDPCFVTGGGDHGVVLWSEGDHMSWEPKLLHKHLHSSAVMGVAGMRCKNIVLSAGADKRVFGFDVEGERKEFKHQIESKCMNVLPNPCDFNLFMVQTAQREKQLRLYDLRLPQTELHCFGWKQESSESQSALVNQSWSPDGLYITSGSADPAIHIFDIRYSSGKPSQSVRAHQKRVFKADWHHSLPLLVSISSDLSIGLHRISS